MDLNVVKVQDTLLAGTLASTKSLKCGSGVAETKWKHFKLSKAPTGDEGSLGSGVKGTCQFPLYMVLWASSMWGGGRGLFGPERA